MGVTERRERRRNLQRIPEGSEREARAAVYRKVRERERDSNLKAEAWRMRKVRSRPRLERKLISRQCIGHRGVPYATYGASSEVAYGTSRLLPASDPVPAYVLWSRRNLIRCSANCQCA
jgi:hypothetical protein